MQEKQKMDFKTKKNYWRHISTGIFCLSVASVAAYLFSANDLSIQSFKLAERKRQADKIETANDELELRSMSLSAFDNLSKRVAGLNMVKVDKVEYLTGAAAVAVKR